jgi:hypothetical protein
MASIIKVEVVKWTAKSAGNLRGFADIKIGKCEFRDCRLVHEEGKTPFVSGPQREYMGNDGKKKYVPLVVFPEDWKDSILQAVWNCYQPDTNAPS